jgi:hypothetical protein
MSITISKMPRMRTLVTAIAFTLIGSVALAQDTSSSVGGRITDAEGAAVAGASVEILHVPSGTRKTVTTDENGRYTSRGLRVGGPFAISATKDGFDSAKDEGVQLKLGELGTVNLILSSEQLLDEVVVSASRVVEVFDSQKMGAGTSVTRDQIDALPSISRSIDDYVRLDPRIVQVDRGRGGLSAAGQNNRYNNITIDGISTNDEFGLNDSGFPALNQPISIDAIEELAIGISSYDVTQADFTGANINAVTKSGTNEFKGTVYGVYRGDNWVGDTPEGLDFTGFEDETTYGITLGGPIIKDRLFFFIAYEDFTRSSPAPTVNRRVVGGVSSQIVSDSDLAAIAARAAQLGLTPGSTTLSGLDNSDEKIIAKIDWNISDQHRAAIRYGRTDGTVQRTPDVGSTSVSGSDHWYFDNVLNENLTAQLYSDWNETFSTEFSLSRNEYSSLPQNGSFAPQISVRVNTTGNDQVFLGTERSRQANQLLADTTTGLLRTNVYLGDHTLSVGADFKRNDVFNLFAQDVFGNYEFASVADFQAGRVSRFRYQFPVVGNDRNSLAADFSLSGYGFFAQDNWIVNNNLTVNYGFRVDSPKIDDRPAFNSAASTTFGRRNDETIDGNYILAPRAGFNYTFDTEMRTQLRGGLGLFSGSSPNVWLSNAFSNTGTLINAFDIRQIGTTPVPVQLSIDPNNQPRLPGTPPTPNIDFIDKDFEQPTLWKASLGLERELPWFGLVGSVEAIVTQTDNNVLYQHLNLGEATGRLPDGRVAYWSSTSAASFLNPIIPGARTRNNNNRAFGNVLLLTNTSKGTSEVLTLSLSKPMEENWGGSLAYTYTNAEESSPGSNSISNSSWSNQLITNSNENLASTSNYVFQDRITASLSYRHFFFEDAPTTISAFYEGRTGRSFSYGFIGDANGDNAAGNNDLFYIPRPGEVIFRGVGNLAAGTTRVVNDPAVEQAFFAYINSVEYLRDRQGSVAERNGAQAPWVSRVDLRISQQLPKIFDVQGEIYFDIENFGNLLNDDWGQIEEVNFPFNQAVARFAGVQDGRYIYQYTGAPTNLSRLDGARDSRWAAQIGFKVKF